MYLNIAFSRKLNIYLNIINTSIGESINFFCNFFCLQIAPLLHNCEESIASTGTL